MTEERVKPRVAIIYSENEKQSLESKNLAHYLCGMLSKSGYAQMYMVPFNPSDSTKVPPNNKVRYLPPKSSQPAEVPGSDVLFCTMNSVAECHLVLVTVNNEDTAPCGNKLVTILENKKKVPIFSMQRGVKLSAILSEEVETRGLTVIEAAIGFAVVLDPRTSAYISTIPSPCVLYQRLSKEEVAIADQPLRLLEHMAVFPHFRKTITPQAWGTLVYENLYALNVLTKGTIRDTLLNRKHRLLYALMIRESLIALHAASKNGTWKPDMLLICEMLPMKLYEMFLILPNFLFYPAAAFFGLLPTANVISPGQLDLTEGRRTMTSFHLAEIVQLGEKYKQPCRICDLVLNEIQQLESIFDSGKFVNLSSKYLQADMITKVQDGAKKYFPTHESFDEFMYYFMRFLAGVAAFAVLIFLFYHD